MLKNIVIITGLAITLSACSGVRSASVKPIQTQDKLLACNDILLEINETEFVRAAAERNRGLNVRNVVSPLGYGSTYMSAAKAIDAADTRINYLKKIYEIRRCETQSRTAAYAPSAPTSSPVSYQYSPHAQANPASYGTAYQEF